MFESCACRAAREIRIDRLLQVWHRAHGWRWRVRWPANPGLTSPIRLAKRRDLRIQEIQRRFERFAVTSTPGGCEVAQHSGPGQLKALAFALPVQLFLVKPQALAIDTPSLGRLYLRLDRFTFPTSCHAFSLAYPGAPASSGPS